MSIFVKVYRYRTKAVKMSLSFSKRPLLVYTIVSYVAVSMEFSTLSKAGVITIARM